MNVARASISGSLVRSLRPDRPVPNGSASSASISGSLVRSLRVVPVGVLGTGSSAGFNTRLPCQEPPGLRNNASDYVGDASISALLVGGLREVNFVAGKAQNLASISALLIRGHGLEKEYQAPNLNKLQSQPS